LSAHAAPASERGDRPPLTATIARFASRSWLATAIAAAIAAACFGATANGTSVNGSYVGPGLRADTIAEIAFTLGGGLLVALACAVEASGRRRVFGIGAAIAFFALAAFSALSVNWSVAPSNSWLEANRTLAYASAFAGAIALVRLWGDRWRSVIAGVLLATLVVSGYAVASEIIPESLNAIGASQELARLQVPFDYWNAVGLTAALGIGPCLWLGARRDGHGVLNALAAPALCLLLVTLVLSYSRGAVLAALVGAAFWFALVPLRLRALALAAVAGFPAAVVLAWTLRQGALADNYVGLAARSSAGHRLGLILLAALVVSFAAAIVLRFAAERNPLSPSRRRLLGIVAAGALALVPLAGVAALAASSRGLFGEISHGWYELTTPSAPQPGNGAARLTSGGSQQALYWHYAIEVFDTKPLTGTGAGSYPVSDQPFMTSHALADNAHGYVFQTLSDLGIVGLVLSLAFAAFWCLAAVRSAGPFRARAPGRDGAERLGLLTLITVVVTFTVHSTIDWTWFVPGDALFALIAAGWVAGRGRPRDRAPAGRPSLARLGRSPLAAATTAAAIAVALVVAWSQWQPLRSEQAATAGDLALGNKQFAVAVADEQLAIARDPLDITPRIYLGDTYAQQGHYALAQTTFETVVAQQPSNFDSWLALWEFDSPYAAAGLLPQRDAAIGDQALANAFYLYPENQQNPSYEAQYLATLK
jgi:O-antigen ligase